MKNADPEEGMIKAETEVPLGEAPSTPTVDVEHVKDVSLIKTPGADTAATSDDENCDVSATTEETITPVTTKRTCLNKVFAFYRAYDFPIHILIAICLAKAYPELGAVYLEPQITATWIATGIIFFISGLGLKTGELYKVIVKRFFFNIFVEGFNFGVVSLIVFGVSRALASSGALPQALADAMVMCSCLPMSINAVIVLTASAHGDEAAAIFHATAGNVIGIFLSPTLIVTYLPLASSDVHLPAVFKDLTLKVIVPLIGGQVVHIVLKRVREFYFAHKLKFKKVQESCLVYIV
jgi:solute carrier family 10 (sodium/bile acid cotransporter), member 7